VRGPGALQPLHEHPWGAQCHAATILFLPRLIADFLHDDGVALAHNLVNLAAMQAFALGRQLAFFFGLAASCPFRACAGYLVEHSLNAEYLHFERALLAVVLHKFLSSSLLRVH
jgi:hypothetical protein